MSIRPLILVLLPNLWLTGCSSTTVSYGNPDDTETVTVEYGSTDLQNIADKMVDSMLTAPVTHEITSQGRPVMFMDSIRNKTAEHIDTEAITDTIRTKLLHAGIFRFVDMSKVAAVKQQLEYQQNSGLVDPASRIHMGQQTGARYMVYGNLTSIVKDNGSLKDVFYQLTLNLMDLQSGELRWAEQKEIRKQAKKSTFGW